MNEGALWTLETKAAELHLAVGRAIRPEWTTVVDNYASCTGLVRLALARGLQPNVCQCVAPAPKDLHDAPLNYRLQTPPRDPATTTIVVHPSSALYRSKLPLLGEVPDAALPPKLFKERQQLQQQRQQKQLPVGPPPPLFAVFQTLTETSQRFASELTLIPGLLLALSVLKLQPADRAAIATALDPPRHPNRFSLGCAGGVAAAIAALAARSADRPLAARSSVASCRRTPRRCAR